MSTVKATTLSGDEVVLVASALEALGEKLHGPLLLPGEAGYEGARRVWNGMINRRPAVIAGCTGVADVIDSLRFAREHDLLISVRGGGHGAAGHAVCEGGMMIDLSRMKGVRCDPEKRSVRAQGGATWGDVDRETQAFGLATPGGVVSDTGIAGLTLGGGLSWMRRKHGMSIDNLRSVDVVTADARYVTADQTRNTDLFWGVRGGGGNFGIVTSFEYECHELGPEVMFAAAMYPLEEAREVLRAWREYIGTVPDEVTTDGLFWSIPVHPAFPEEVRGRSVIILAGLFAGDAGEGERQLQPLREVSAPVLDLSEIMPFRAVQTAFDPFFPKIEQCYYFKSCYMDAIGDDAIDTIIKRFEERPSPKTLVSIRYLGGAIKRVGAEETAFGDRSSEFLLSIDSVWDEPAASDANVAWSREFWDDMQRFATGKMYFNFPGLLEEGESLLRDSFGPNYKRLVRLKNTYDPRNFFRLNQNIPPEGS